MGLVPRGHPRRPGACCSRELQGPGAKRLLGGCCMGQPGQGQCPGCHWGMRHEGLPRCVLVCPSPGIFFQRFEVHPATRQRQPPLPRAGGGERCCSHRGREQAAPGSSGGHPAHTAHGAARSSHAAGTQRRDAEAQGSCSNHVPALLAPLGRALEARRALGHRWAALAGHGMAAKASPSALPVPPPHHGQPLRLSPPLQPGCLLAGPA